MVKTFYFFRLIFHQDEGLDEKIICEFTKIQKKANKNTKNLVVFLEKVFVPAADQLINHHCEEQNHRRANQKK